MVKSCVNCGAPFEADDVSCWACGLTREASLPPGPPAPPAAPPPPVEPPPAPEPPPEPVEPVEPPPPVESPPVPEPGRPADEPPPELEAPPTASEPAPVDPVAPPPEELWPAPVPDPAEEQWVPEQQWAPAEDLAAEQPPRRRVGVLDVLVTLLGVAAALAIGLVLTSDDVDVQRWLQLRNPTELNGHDLLVALIAQSPFAVAVIAACVSRVPGTALLVALAGQVPIVVNDQFTAGDDWPLLIALIGFALVDLVLLLRGRTLVTGLVAGVVGAVAVGGYRGIWLQSFDVLRPMLDEPVELLYFLVVPAGLALLGGVLGGAFALLRRRA